MRPLAGVRLTLVSRDVHTPYSGMLPGYVSGFYTYDGVHIDLSRLAAFASARLIHDEACGLDIAVGPGGVGLDIAVGPAGGGGAIRPGALLLGAAPRPARSS
jgi:hypothetical protein